MREEIDPIKRQQTDDRDSRQVFFRDGPIHDSQPRYPAGQYDHGIEIENDQRTERDERERIPLPRGQKISTEKRDAGASRSTSQAGQTGEREEGTSRPR